MSHHNAVTALKTFRDVCDDTFEVLDAHRYRAPEDQWWAGRNPFDLFHAFQQAAQPVMNLAEEDIPEAQLQRWKNLKDVACREAALSLNLIAYDWEVYDQSPDNHPEMVMADRMAMDMAAFNARDLFLYIIVPETKEILADLQHVPA